MPLLCCSRDLPSRPLSLLFRLAWSPCPPAGLPLLQPESFPWKDSELEGLDKHQGLPSLPR